MHLSAIVRHFTQCTECKSLNIHITWYNKLVSKAPIWLDTFTNTLSVQHIRKTGMRKRQRGAILCIGSGASQIPTDPLYAGYCGTKAAVETFCRSLQVCACFCVQLFPVSCEKVSPVFVSLVSVKYKEFSFLFRPNVWKTTSWFSAKLRFLSQRNFPKLEIRLSPFPRLNRKRSSCILNCLP